MKSTVSFLRQVRQNILDAINGLSSEQLNSIPQGFNNNIIWNAAHVLVTQQLLVYKLSGLKTSVSEEEIASYKKGSKPLKKVSEQEIEDIKKRLMSSVDKFQEDLENDEFKSYHTYTTSFGLTLSSSQEAMEFNNIHEGLHYGSILALKKLV